MAAVYLEGQAALGDYLRSLTTNAGGSAKLVFCFFDFDRTLTNGENFDINAPVEGRIRGGKHTLNALEKLHQAGANMYIVTARQPRKLVIEQLQQSLQKAQKELIKYFSSDSKIEEISFQDTPLAIGGRLYACGYQKAMGVAHALTTIDPSFLKSYPKLQVYFFDDAVVNSAAVITTLYKILQDAKRKDLIDKIELRSCWWDSFSEDTGQAPTMKPVHSESSDFNYHDYLQNDLKRYKISNEERELRRNVYLKEEKEQGRKPPSALIEKTKPKKLGDLDESHAGLAAFLKKK